MSLTSLATSSKSHSFSSISSLDECRYQPENTVFSIEQIRQQLNSCFTCGVSWPEDHVSLDCAECGGYSLQRPCVVCEGKCHVIWKRDLAMSHASGKARWLGECAINNNQVQEKTDRILKPIPSSIDCNSKPRRTNV